MINCCDNKQMRPNYHRGIVTIKFIITSMFRYTGTTEAILLEENDV
jgi:hypothetical protein